MKSRHRILPSTSSSRSGNVLRKKSGVHLPTAGQLFSAPTKTSEEERGKRMKADVMIEVERYFRPEFLNRLDDIILFHRLKRANMNAIVDIQMVRLKKLVAERKIEIELSDAARTLLADKGYDPAYGARPLKRVIQKQVQDPLAEEILAGAVKDGDTVKVDALNGAITINGKVVGAPRVPAPKTVH